MKPPRLMITTFVLSVFVSAFAFAQLASAENPIPDFRIKIFARCGTLFEGVSQVSPLAKTAKCQATLRANRRSPSYLNANRGRKQPFEVYAINLDEQQNDVRLLARGKTNGKGRAGIIFRLQPEKLVRIEATYSDSSPKQQDFQFGLPKSDKEKIECSTLKRKWNLERERIQSCTVDADCGKPLPLTSCGCTRDLVARVDADPTNFYEITENMMTNGCEELPITTCDCPEVNGFACLNGTCTWDYAAQR